MSNIIQLRPMVKEKEYGEKTLAALMVSRYPVLFFYVMTEQKGEKENEYQFSFHALLENDGMIMIYTKRITDDVFYKDIEINKYTLVGKHEAIYSFLEIIAVEVRGMDLYQETICETGQVIKLRGDS